MNDLERAAAILRHQGTPARLQPFDQALLFLGDIEGGLANIPGDRGGLTNWGISSATYPNVDIRALTWPEARTLYFADFWLEAYCHVYSYPLAVTVFDYAVHSSPRQAVKTLQREIGTRPDGKVGENTRKALVAAMLRRGGPDVATGVNLRRAAFMAERFRRKQWPISWLCGYMRRLVLLERELHREIA